MFFCLQSYEKSRAKQKNFFIFLLRRSKFATFVAKLRKKSITLSFPQNKNVIFSKRVEHCQLRLAKKEVKRCFPWFYT